MYFYFCACPVALLLVTKCSWILDCLALVTSDIGLMCWGEIAVSQTKLIGVAYGNDLGDGLGDGLGIDFGVVCCLCLCW